MLSVMGKKRYGHRGIIKSVEPSSTFTFQRLGHCAQSRGAHATHGPWVISD